MRASCCSLTRPQVDERDDELVAVERFNGGNGWLRICRHGLEKVMWREHFPPRVGDVDVKELLDGKIQCPVWRTGHAARDAGATAGGADGVMLGLGQLRALAACACV